MLAAISERIQSTMDESERIAAYAELKAYILENPADADALSLMDKYGRRFETDWQARTVSPRP